MANIKIFSDDTYGCEFFKKLTNRLKNDKKINVGWSVNTDRLPGKCYTKIERVIRASNLDFEKIVIIADADGPHNKSKVFQEINIHIPEGCKSKTKLIILDYELEEWICCCLGINFQKSKPSEALSDWCRRQRDNEYKKWQLPNFVKELNTDILQTYPSFKEFVNVFNQ